ncbi:MAG: hypothetical protein JW910_08775 [Anaerolineae bacterium]|nr:hypothetical protein [Anaerolineae bacterium]
MRRLGLWIILMTIMLSAGPILAQGPENCPASVLLALGRAGAACARLERGQACYGNGAVSASLRPPLGSAAFDLPGALIDAAALDALSVGGGDPEAGFSVALIELQADLPVEEQRSVTGLLFGAASLANGVPFTPEVMLSATGTLNLRATPEADGEIVARLGVRDTVLANGRTADGTWFRVLVPGTVDLAWASALVVTTSENSAVLPVVEAETPFYRPFQVFTLRSAADDALCEGAPESGLLLQTPSREDAVTLIANGVTLRLAATIFLQTADDTLLIAVLDGGAEVEASGVTQYVPAGARVLVPLGEDGNAAAAPPYPEPYDLANVAALPVNVLPFRFAIPAPLSLAVIDTLVAAHNAPEPTPVPTPDRDYPQQCIRTMRVDADLWAGPGTFYEVVNHITAGTRVTPVLQTTDADGSVWWQLQRDNWVLARLVDEEGECVSVPVADTIPAPRENALSLETCEASNGPLREGQVVTISFRPPSWETYEDARLATRVDPGEISVDGQQLSVHATNPVQIGEAAWVRTFSATWIATAGMHRFVGDRLHYTPICNLTVPAGP